MSTTQELFREDSYAKCCDAVVLGVNDLAASFWTKPCFILSAAASLVMRAL